MARKKRARRKSKLQMSNEAHERLRKKNLNKVRSTNDHDKQTRHSKIAAYHDVIAGIQRATKRIVTKSERESSYENIVNGK